MLKNKVYEIKYEELDDSKIIVGDKELLEFIVEYDTRIRDEFKEEFDNLTAEDVLKMTKESLHLTGTATIDGCYIVTEVK